MKQKTDVELLSEITGLEVATIISVNPRIYSKNALDAMKLISHQLQATVDELKQRCEELEKYARHKDECDSQIIFYKHPYNKVCKNCHCVAHAHNYGSCSNTLTNFEAVCTCGLDNLLTPNERK